ncbi:MAG TPA: sodium-independent anion transporter, partial [Terriglobales bacterium]|nr:sodium-independent anion transporter [Terriglobales bacterium]
RVQELPPPRHLVSRRPLVLQVYGHLFYASAPALQRLLPRPGRAEAPVVILRLRGYSTLGTTLMDVLDGYSHELEAAGGRLYLSGLSDSAYEELRRSRKLDLRGPLQVHAGTSVLGESTRTAQADAQAWLVRARTHGDDAA